jgi:hypothetical protein
MSIAVATPGVGADVESVCGKCGDVWHVVVAKVGDDIVKVECKECGRQHCHRSGKVTRRASAAKSTATSRPPRMMAPARTIQPDPSRPPRDYRPSETFAVADQVMHPQFGLGIVAAATPERVEITFSVGNKVLAHARGGPGLERPRVVLATVRDDDEEEEEQKPKVG